MPIRTVQPTLFARVNIHVAAFGRLCLPRVMRSTEENRQGARERKRKQLKALAESGKRSVQTFLTAEQVAMLESIRAQRSLPSRGAALADIVERYFAEQANPQNRSPP